MPAAEPLAARGGRGRSRRPRRVPSASASRLGQGGHDARINDAERRSPECPARFRADAAYRLSPVRVPVGCRWWRCCSRRSLRGPGRGVVSPSSMRRAAVAAVAVVVTLAGLGAGRWCRRWRCCSAPVPMVVSPVRPCRRYRCRCSSGVVPVSSSSSPPLRGRSCRRRHRRRRRRDPGPSRAWRPACRRRRRLAATTLTALKQNAASSSSTKAKLTRFRSVGCVVSILILLSCSLGPCSAPRAGTRRPR